MAKTANQDKMHSLHDQVATIFIAVLERYKLRMEVVDALAGGTIDMQELNDEVLDEIFKDGAMPSPSMMAAVTKFLKDNEVVFEKEKIDQISDQQRALEERRKNRPNLAQLTVVPKAIGE